MIGLQHENLVRLLGVCWDEQLMVMEYMVEGDLNSYLRKQFQYSELTNFHLLYMAFQVASGKS